MMLITPPYQVPYFFSLNSWKVACRALSPHGLQWLAIRGGRPPYFGGKSWQVLYFCWQVSWNLKKVGRFQDPPSILRGKVGRLQIFVGRYSKKVGRFYYKKLAGFTRKRGSPPLISKFITGLIMCSVIISDYVCRRPRFNSIHYLSIHSLPSHYPLISDISR